MGNHRKAKSNFRSILSNIKKKSTFSRAREKFFEITDIPLYMQKNTTRITIINSCNIFVEQYESVADYFSHYIRIKCFGTDVIIEGKDLNIDEITKDELIIKGNIDSIRYKK